MENLLLSFVASNEHEWTTVYKQYSKESLLKHYLTKIMQKGKDLKIYPN